MGLFGIFLLSEAREKVSRGCVVGTESVNWPHVDRESSLHPSEEDKPAVEKVTVKQEKGDEKTDGSVCCLDSIKIEDFSPERMLEVQSKMLEEWKPEVDIQIQDSATLRSCTGQAQGKKPNCSFSSKKGLIESLKLDGNWR